jgi:hypothetical protein
LFDDLMTVTAKFPWWVGVVLAIGSYLGFHAVAAAPDVLIPLTPETAGEFTRARLFKTLATFLQYVLPAAFLLGAVGSLILRLKKKVTTDTVDAGSEASAKVTCPSCGGPMKLRTARRGESAGEKFYGCTKFPKCRGTRPLTEP